MLQGHQMAPIQLDSYHDVRKEAAGWAHQIDIQSNFERERFLTDCFFNSVWKDLLFVIDEDFVYITLWYTKTTTHVLLGEAPRR